MHRDGSRFARSVRVTTLECTSPHTCTLVFGARAIQYADELKFAGDPYLSEADLDGAKAEGKFAKIAPITKGANGVWHARVNLRASKTTNFPGVLPDYYK